MAVLGFIQARETSKRLPGKIYADIGGVPLLYHVVDRAKQSALMDDVILLSPRPLPDVPEGVRNFWMPANFDENDVLARFAACLANNPCDYVVRLTADCPFLDTGLIDQVIANGIGADYCSNVLTPSFPDGVDCEMMSADLLEWMNERDMSAYDREHVTSFIRKHHGEFPEMQIVSVENSVDYSSIKTSIDTAEDLEIARRRCVETAG